MSKRTHTMTRGDTVELLDDPDTEYYDIKPGTPLLVTEVFGDSLQVAYTDYEGRLVTEIVGCNEVKHAPR